VRRRELTGSLLFLALIAWLLKTADSATSIMAFTVGALTLIVLGFRVVSKRYLGTVVLVSLIVVAAAQMAFDLYVEVLRLLGRDPSLTDRTVLWADALALQDSPLLGVGFESFWLGYRLDVLWSKWWWRPNQVHNGYLETYLTLGIVGVALLLGVVVSTFRKIQGRLITDFDFARLRLAFLFAILAFNYTEAAFKAVHLVWTIFYIIAIDYPKPHRAIQPNRTRVAMQRGRLREARGRTS
jgi:O-antigen ligase